MTTKTIMSAFALLITLSPVFCLANSAPVVSNVSVSQRADDSKLVDIYYNLADADGDSSTVWVTASDANGNSWQVPIIATTGAIGQGIAPDVGKHIIWDAGRDIPGKVGNYKVRVLADDGKGPAPMVFVPAGNFQGVNGGIYVNSFMIDKYEVTNAFYCEFLNSADPYSAYYNNCSYGVMEIARSGSSGNYYYSVNPGRENYPVYNVTLDDARAFAQWRSSIQGGTFRLPTEQEWEKAAGWDPVLQKLWAYGFQSANADCSWGNSNSCYGGTLPVGSFNGTGGKNDAKSYYGCYDMSGNVSEWTNSGTVHGCSFNDFFWPVTWSGTNNCTGFRLVLVAE
jgi:Uncharacterized conserved protein